MRVDGTVYTATGNTAAADVKSTFADYEPYGVVPDGWWDELRRARQACPVAHSGRSGGFWLVTRAEDVETILRSPHKFSSADGITIPHHPDAPPQPPIELDPPLHTAFRRLLRPYFAAAATRPYRPLVAEMARELIARFEDMGECEFLTAFARPLPAMALGRIVLGIEDLGELLELQQQVTVIAGQNNSDEAQGAWLALRGYVEAVMSSAARRPPCDGLVSALAHGTVAGKLLGEEERIGTLMLLILGGLGTTSDTISTIMVRLTDDPTLEDRLRDPGWIARGDLDELLRIDSPVQWVGRTVTTRVELGEVTLQPGERVMVHIGSANRDEARFTDPDTLDFARSGGRGLAYGVGPHHCIGVHLAQMVLGVAFEELLARLTGFHRDRGVPLTVRDGISRPLLALPVTFQPR